MATSSSERRSACKAGGAARNYYTDAEWKDAVAKWMDEALVLVVIPGLTGGLGWELASSPERSRLIPKNPALDRER